MIPEGLDRSISTVIAVASAALAWWAHQRELTKEKKRIYDEQKKKYADRELKEYAAARDFGHIQRDLAQLKTNTDYLMREGDQRLDDIEKRLATVTGTVDVLKELARQRQAG
jgi:uncharacterized protein YoxC